MQARRTTSASVGHAAWRTLTGPPFSIRSGRAMTSRCASVCASWRASGIGSVTVVSGILLAREGLRANHKKLYRSYAEERLAVKRRRGPKRAMGTRRPAAAGRPGQRAMEPRLRVGCA